jgi:hypothetical protein
LCFVTRKLSVSLCVFVRRFIKFSASCEAVVLARANDFDVTWKWPSQWPSGSVARNTALAYRVIVYVGGNPSHLRRGVTVQALCQLMTTGTIDRSRCALRTSPWGVEGWLSIPHGISCTMHGSWVGLSEEEK